MEAMVAAYNRRIRKLYLDNKRRKISTTYLQSDIPTYDVNKAIIARERRKFRKTYLDNKRRKRCSFTSPTQISHIVFHTAGRSSTTPNSSNQTPGRMYELISEDQFVGISDDYIDHGDQTIVCASCASKLWKDESIRGRTTHCVNSFSLCCGTGKVRLPSLKDPDDTYKNLYSGVGERSKVFIKNIRRYNSMFSFTSMGGKVDTTINRGNAPFIYRMSGQNYHSIGSLLPATGSKPKFSQLYIYDTENEVRNKLSVMGQQDAQTSHSCAIDTELIKELQAMLDSNNQLVKTYRNVRDCLAINPQIDLKLKLIAKRQQDGRTYNLPTTSEVAALIVGDISDSIEPRDIIITTRSGQLKRISELHPSYLPLQYPLLFPFGDDGYRTDIRHRDLPGSSTMKKVRCMMREFFAYRIQDRLNKFSVILNSRRLFQQFLVDAYTMIESERLLYIRTQQKILRCSSFENLQHARHEGNVDMSSAGQRVILPSSFTGGARYMMQNYLDAMALCRFFGFPDFFITITCNPKWPEIRRFLKDTTLNPEDRPDILCRLFKLKLDSLIKDLKENHLLGRVQAAVYTIEFQKRGLPHAYICLFMHPDHKISTVDRVDPFISAEIPDKNLDLQLYNLVSDFMIHGPCGHHNIKCPCMIENRCSKQFPKKFREHTPIDGDGFPLYRRRECTAFVVKSGVRLDSRNVVPYNQHLLKRYQAHINVEWCNQAGSIKYLFKYINKGPDRITVTVTDGVDEVRQQDAVDEIKEYYDCRYLSACEAAWRIYSYDIHYRTPAVMRLPFHLPGQQPVVYDADDDIDDVLEKPSVASTMFTSWMECNSKDATARDLNYVDFPTKFTWIGKDRSWKPREKGFSIGRIHSVSPSLGEPYYLRILLNKVKGPTSFEQIRTVNGEVYDTFRDACYALGLLDDDTEYIDAIHEASHTSHGKFIRTLFASMLMTSSLSRPEHVWESCWQHLSNDILYTQHQRLNSPDLILTDDQIKNLTLLHIENILRRNNSTLLRYPTMPYPDDDSVRSSTNLLIHEQMSYNVDNLNDQFQQHLSSLTDEQHAIFKEITEAVDEDKGGLFFVYGYGGTGKTFLWKTLSSYIRSRAQIVLEVASSGIASLLLSGGRTAHSRFIIPFNLTEDSMCSIQPGTDLHILLQQTKLIIWDEAPMLHKHGFEALDRSMQDLLLTGTARHSNIPFGGKVVVFGGDFRQILHVIPNGSRQDIVGASFSSSHLWSKCIVLRLTKNMRLSRGGTHDHIERTRLFAQWLLDIGEGKLGGPNDGEAVIEIPNDLLLPATPNPLKSLIDFVYPSIL